MSIAPFISRKRREIVLMQKYRTGLTAAKLDARPATAGLHDLAACALDSHETNNAGENESETEDEEE